MLKSAEISDASCTNDMPAVTRWRPVEVTGRPSELLQETDRLIQILQILENKSVWRRQLCSDNLTRVPAEEGPAAFSNLATQMAEKKS